jgi:hypothetical protein
MTIRAWRKKRMPSQREQYGDTVHLFIDTGQSPYKITFIPFTFDNNPIVIYRGAFSSLSRFHSLLLRRSFLTRTFGSVSTFVLFRSTAMPTLVRRYLLTHCTTEILLNPVFEDLRTPKVPNIRFHQLYKRNTPPQGGWLKKPNRMHPPWQSEHYAPAPIDGPPTKQTIPPGSSN